jgi:hypothetical protein
MILASQASHTGSNPVTRIFNIFKKLSVVYFRKLSFKSDFIKAVNIVKKKKRYAAKLFYSEDEEEEYCPGCIG